MSGGRLKATTPLAIAVMLAASVVSMSAIRAQDTDGSKGPSPGDPRKTIPEKIEPGGPLDSVPRQRGPDGPAQGKETLSDELGRSGGVIRPPTQGLPSMQVPAPVPNPNTTPVIPPPGSPGNPSPVRPK